MSVILYQQPAEKETVLATTDGTPPVWNVSGPREALYAEVEIELLFDGTQSSPANARDQVPAYKNQPGAVRSALATHCFNSPSIHLEHRYSFVFNMKKALGETQTLRAGSSKAEPKIFAPPQTPFPGARDGQSLICWRWSLPLPTNPVW